MCHHVFHWWHWTFKDLRFVPQNLYIRKQVMRFWQSWRQLSKWVRLRFWRPDLSYPSLLQLICCDKRVSNNQLTHTPCHHREEERRRNFLSCSDHSWIKMTAIFFPLPSSLSISFSVDFFLYSTKRWSYGTEPFDCVQINECCWIE